MTTDNRTSEPAPEQVEAAAKAMHGTGNPWFAAYGDWGAAGFEIKKAFRDSARAALLAAATIPQPVIHSKEKLAPPTDREELIAELREVAGVNPLDVTCGECGSKPGKRCYGNGEMRRTHSSRASKAEHDLRAVAADALEAATSERDAAVAAIERVRALHPKHEVLICGAMAEVPHRHGSEREPYPIRPVTCTKLQGHEGSHRDASCCWNFQEFDNVAAYKSDEWADRSICSHCQTAWPCLTVAALDGAWRRKGGAK